MEKNYTIADLREGKVAVEHDGTRKQLNSVLMAAWPEGNPAWGTSRYYFRKEYFNKWTDRVDLPDMPVQSSSQFQLPTK